MSSYKGFERKMADLLDSFPALRYFAGSAYRRLNYLVYRQPHSIFEISTRTSLMTPQHWAGIEENVDSEEFFGYYDKTPWSADANKMLMHHLRRSDHAKVDIIVYDSSLRRVNTLGSSRAWNRQQGSMAQWLPGQNDPHVIYNDFVAGKLVSRIVDVSSGELVHQLSLPIQAIHSSGQEALTLNYCRLDLLRPEYGYRVIAKNLSYDQPLDRDGIWWLDIRSNRAELRLSLSELCSFTPRREMREAQHKVNHFHYSPDNEHFVFLHRWIGPRGKFSRLYVAKSDISQPKLLLDDRMVSHYCWRDTDHLLVWARTKAKGDKYYIINIHSGDLTTLGEGVLNPYGDGHPSFSPNGRWLLTDSYPNKARQRYLLLFDTHSDSLIQLGRFFSPWKFDGPTRCDLHPRWSPDGRFVSFDSAHEGIRRSYVLDLNGLCKDAANSQLPAQ